MGNLQCMSDEHTSSPVVGPVDQQWLDQVSPWLNAGDLPAITVLPRRIMKGKAVYGDDIGPLVKGLRSEGFDAAFLNTPDQAFDSRYSTVSDILISFVINIGSTGAWEASKFLLNKIRHQARDMKSSRIDPQCKMTLGLVKYPVGSSVMWQEISGPAEDVLDFAASIARNYIGENTDSDSAENEASAGSDHLPQDATE